MRLSVDVGGTFTDLVLEAGDGTFRLFKSPTRPDDPVQGCLEVLQRAADADGRDRAALLGACELFLHATTRATNAVLTGRTARTAFLTTEGHPDIFLLREGGRVDPFDNTVPFPDPLVPRRLTFEVPERMRADGVVHRPLDEDAVRAVIARLEAAGIAVETGLGEAEARFDNAGFFARVETGRPLVALKTATTLDGRIAAQGGESRWITGPAARAAAHRLRAGHDAVMVGARTALLDNPRLDCRLDGLQDRSPLRIVADGSLGLPPTHHLAADGRPCRVLCREDADAGRAKALEDAGVRLIRVPAGEDGRMDLAAGLRRLGEAGLTRLLVEGGGMLAAALLKAGLVDRIHWFRAPAVMGGDGAPAVAALGAESPGDAPRFRLHARREAGGDTWEVWQRCSPE